MDAAGVRTVVNLDGGWGDRLDGDRSRPSTRPTPAGSSRSPWSTSTGSTTPTGAEREAERLEESFKAGAKGLKFHKSFGLSYRYKDGRLVPVDDPKLDPIWEMCAKHKRPVVIHVADPAAFFTPAGPLQRALARAEPEPRLALLRRQVPQAAGPARPAPPRDRQAPEDHVHQHPLRQQRRGPRVRRRQARQVSEHVSWTSTPGSRSWAGSRTRPASSS